MTQLVSSGFRVLAACAAVLLLAAPARAERCAAPQIEGTWIVEVTLDGPPPGFPTSFTALESYSRGCAMTTTNNLPPAARGGQGEWVQDGGRRFHTVIQFLTADDAGPTGAIVVTHSLLLGSGGKYTGEGDAELFDTAGNSLGVIPFSSSAVRLYTALHGS
jgi:hypothetical protein